MGMGRKRTVPIRSPRHSTISDQGASFLESGGHENGVLSTDAVEREFRGSVHLLNSRFTLSLVCHD